MRPRLLPGGMLLLLFACAEETEVPKARPSGHAGTDLTRTAPGEATPEKIRRRVPDVTLLRTSAGFSCRVAVHARDRFSWVALEHEGKTLGRLETSSAEDPAELGFMIPLTTRGLLVFRTGFPDGETWRRTITL